MLAKNGPISLVGTKAPSRSLKMGGEFSAAMAKVWAFGSSWEPKAETDVRITPPTRLKLAVGCTVYSRCLVFGVMRQERDNPRRAHNPCSKLSRPSNFTSSVHMSSARTISVQIAVSQLN